MNTDLPATIPARVMVKAFQSFIVSFTTTKNGRIVSSKAIDEVMEDIFDRRKIMERICRSSTIQDLKSIFFGLDFNMVCAFMSKEETSCIINELILLNLEIRQLSSRYQKLSKKGGNKKRRERIKKQLNSRKKKYKNAVKLLREDLNIFDNDKEVKFKDKYKSLDKFLERKNDPYYLAFDDYDYDDDDDFDDETKELLGGRPRPYKYDQPVTSGLNPYFAQFMNRSPVSSSDEFEDEDLDNDLEDDFEEDLLEKFESLQEQNASILSATAAILSQIGGGVVETSDNQSIESLNAKIADLSNCIRTLQANQRKLVNENTELTQIIQKINDDSLDTSDCDDVSDLMGTILDGVQSQNLSIPAVEVSPSNTPVNGIGLAEDDSEDDRPVKKEETTTTEEVVVTETEVEINGSDLNTSQLIDKVNDENGKIKATSSSKSTKSQSTKSKKVPSNNQ